MIASLIYFLIAIIILAVVVWVIDYFIRQAGAPQIARTALYLIAALIALLLALRMFGFWV